jgi:hypothetical protein
MFLHLKYNMILFVLKIFNHIQIKHLILCLLYFYNLITEIKYKHTPLLLCLSHTHIYILQNDKNSK